jgi:hypothetical protein
MAKYIITGYNIVNGTKSDKKEYNKIVNSKDELEAERRLLEAQNNCFVNRMLGERERIATINFIYKEI